MMRREATLELSLFAASNPLRSAERTRCILEAIDRVAPIRPEVVVGTFKGAFDIPALEPKLLREASAPFTSLVLRTKTRDAEYKLNFDGESERYSLYATMPSAALEREERSAQLVAFVRSLAGMGRALFARAHDVTDLELSDERRGGPLLVPGEIDDVYWLTLWGRELVDRAGRQRVLSTPAYRVEELADGSVLLLTRPTPLDALGPEGRRAQARALAHLRSDKSDDEIYAALMARSQKLAPVELKLHPEVAPLLELFIEDAAKSEREQEIARLNAYTPPPVTEMRDTPLPADLGVDDALDDYDDRAEQLVALVRKHIPEIESFDPSVVPRLDYYFWRMRFAEDFDRKDVEDDLVPALGAYVALVMVRHLGGTLVPRRALDDSQVVIGGRAFLPFLRAHHALASRHAQIDHSMTQLLCIAKQHRGD